MGDQKTNSQTAIKRPPRLADEVYESLYARLMSQDVPPGSRMSIDSLVRELGVSHTPIREAMSRLEAQGLVIKTHLVGYSAAPQITQTELAKLYDMRLLLEPHAASEAALNLSEAMIGRLEKLDAEMCDIDPRSMDDYGIFAGLDGEFHDLIVEASGNELIRDALSRLNTHVHLFRLFFHARATMEAISEHRKILGALRERNPDLAKKAMHDHILASRRRFLTTSQDKPD